ncbi:MAG: hypothetical protein B7Y39_08135 [Bdellovibrio sp. 28-41-41]|nr:MAG: hypothetical protein B7Y39_08135 [Bdellovibrio sp. 28-41-41]
MNKKSLVFKRSVSSFICLTLIASSSTLAAPVIPEKGLRDVSPKMVDAPNSIGYQKPENFFEPSADGTKYIPENYTELTTQRAEWIHDEANIVKRVEADNLRKDLITIAVIDQGVDIGNKNIRDRIAFDVVNGRIVGAGIDFIGADRFASAVLLDPWIYSIGSKGINEAGQIQGARGVREDNKKKNPKDQPLYILENQNDILVQQLMDRIRSNPKLSSTFFSKLNTKNTNIIGLLRLINFEPNADFIAKLKAADAVVKPKMNPAILAKEPELKATHDFANSSWIMDKTTGLPDFFSRVTLETLDGLDTLLSEMKAIYTEENEKYSEFKKNVDLVSRYFKIHHFSTGANKMQLENYAYAKFSEQIAIKKQGSMATDNSYNLLLELRAQKIRNPKADWTVLVENALMVYRKVFVGMAQHPDSQREFSEVSAFVTAFQSADEVEKFLLERNKDFNYDKQVDSLNEKGIWAWVKGISSEIRRRSIRALHPLLHRESIESDHGTHVSGTAIPYMGDRYRILPFRVNLGLVRANKNIQQEMVKKNLAALEVWFKKPVVARAVKAQLTKIGINLNHIDVETGTGAEQLAKFMVQQYRGNLKADVSGSGIVGQVLHWEISSAIEEIAKKKVTIANLSLGGIGQQPELRPTMDTVGEKFASQLDFIFMEFQKYTIAEAVVTKGKNTLFFMAAGNSNNFADADIRSNYPADLRSKWLNEHAKAGDFVPGEKTDNVAIVMSSNENGKLSNFTNAIFTNKAIFAIRGEDVLSQTFRYNLGGAINTVATKAPWLSNAMRMLSTLDPEDGRLDDIKTVFNLTTEDILQNRGIIIEAIRAEMLHLGLKGNDGTLRMDGTSMASPRSASTTGEHELKHRSTALNGAAVGEAEAYGKEGFLPSDIIKRMQSAGKWTLIGEPAPDASKIKYTTLSEFEKESPQSKKNKALEGELDTIKKSNILCIRVYGGK